MKVATILKLGLFVKDNWKKILVFIGAMLLSILMLPIILTAEFLPDAEEEEIQTYVYIGTELGVPWQHLMAFDMVMYDNKLKKNKVDPYDNAQRFISLVYTRRNKDGEVTRRIRANTYKEVKSFFKRYGSGSNIIEKIDSINSGERTRISISARDVEGVLKEANFNKRKRDEFYDLLASGVFEEISYSTGYIGITPGDYEYVEIVGSNNWVWPTISTRITSKFGPRKKPCAECSALHLAVDVGATTPGVDGDPIWSMADGVVINVVYGHKTMGNGVFIDHGNGVVSRYIHLSEIYVTKGQFINRSHIIGRMGNTGSSTATHLDFQIKINGTAVNPLHYFNL